MLRRARHSKKERNRSRNKKTRLIGADHDGDSFSESKQTMLQPNAKRTGILKKSDLATSAGSLLMAHFEETNCRTTGNFYSHRKTGQLEPILEKEKKKGEHIGLN